VCKNLFKQVTTATPKQHLEDFINIHDKATSP